MTDGEAGDATGGSDSGADTSGASSSMLAKGRMEALSDGVLAFAMTLLVVDLTLRPPGSPLHQLFAAWPAYLAYVVSFITIGAGWIAHNALTDGLERVDRIFLRLNLLFLMFVAFLPFPTMLVGDALHQGAGAERVAAVVYGASLLAIRLLYFALAEYSRARHLRQARAEDADMRESGRKFRIVVSGYAATIVLGLFMPTVAIAVYLVIAIFLFVPFRAVLGELTGHS
jgi:uncharacterized membrane protein